MCILLLEKYLKYKGENEMLNTLKPNDIAYGFRFIPAEFKDGKKTKDSVVTNPIRGMMACERVERINDKALNNEDDKIQYFIPVDSSDKPIWLKAQHVLNGWHFARNEVEANLLKDELVDATIDELMDEIRALKGGH